MLGAHHRSGKVHLKTQHQLIGCAVLSILVFSGCSSGNEAENPSTLPNPHASDSAALSNPGTKPLPHSGAPKVENPLPASVLDGDPCIDALTPAQVKEALGNEVPPESQTLAVGKSCSRSVPSRGSLIAITYDTTTKEGLSALYERVKPQAVVWKELPQYKDSQQ